MALKQKTVYFRAEDLAKWEAISNKAEWLHMMLSEEEMQSIPGYEGRYSITRSGKIWSHPRARVKGNWIPSYMGERGYYYVRLSKDGKNTTTNLHRLLALTYIPNPDNLPQVNHIDGNKTNNSLDNLEWCDASYNQQEARRLGLITQVKGEQHGGSKLTETDVNEIAGLLHLGNTELAARFNVDAETIQAIRKGRTWR